MINFSMFIYLKIFREEQSFFYGLLFIFPKDSAMYAIESSLPLSGVNIFNMDAVNGMITTNISLQSGSNYFYQV